MSVLLDFDGTLSLEDADFYLAERAPRRKGDWRPLADAYESLRIDLRTYFRRYFELTGLDREEIAHLAPGVPRRPGLRPFAEALRERGWLVRVVSEGLLEWIEPALAAEGLDWLPVSANRLGPDGRSLVPAPDAEPCPRCVNCKGSQVRRLQARGYRVALLGDGASDLCGAREAELVLARDRLLRLCRAEGLPARPWEDFADALRELDRWAGT